MLVMTKFLQGGKANVGGAASRRRQESAIPILEERSGQSAMPPPKAA